MCDQITVGLAAGHKKDDVSCRFGVPVRYFLCVHPLPDQAKQRFRVFQEWK